MPNPLLDPFKTVLIIAQKQIEAEAGMTATTIEEAVRVMQAGGMTPEQIRAQLLDDLHAEVSRYFGGFKSAVKDAVYGAENMARSLGAKAALRELGPERMYRWQTNGVNICPDCADRHGEEDTLANWEVRGLPTMFGSRCAENCLCTLVPTDMILDPIQVGQEAV